MKKTVKIWLSGLLTFIMAVSGAGSALAATITLPAALTVLGEEAFMGDTSLDEVVIPDGVTEIKDRCFANSSLQAIRIPASVKSIASNAFTGTTPVYYIASPASFSGNLDDRGTVHLTQNATISGTVTFNNTTLIVDSGVTLNVYGTLTGSRLEINGEVNNRGTVKATQSVKTGASGILAIPVVSAHTEIPEDSFYGGLHYQMAIGTTMTVTKDETNYAIKAIGLGDDTAVIATAGTTAKLCFTPTVTATYVFASSGSADTIGHLYDASGKVIISNDDSGENSNFKITYKLTANTTYLFGAKYYSISKTGTIAVNLSSNELQLKITGQPKNVIVAAGETASFHVTATGIGLTYQWQQQAAESSTWSKSSLGGNATDTLSFKAAQSRNGMKFRCAVTDANGSTIYSDPGTLTVASLQDIAAGEEATVSIGNGGEKAMLRFIPTQTGAYTLTSLGSVDTYGYLYDATGSEIAHNDDGGEGKNFKITQTLTAGTTYFYGVKYYKADVTGSIDLMLTADFNDVSITAQPQDLTVKPDETATFCVTATGSGLTYQWQTLEHGASAWQNTSLNGSNKNTLSFKATQSQHLMRVRCRVTSSLGIPVYSKAATLYVTTAGKQCRALLISEVSFNPVCARNESDVQTMKKMLQSVRDPSGTGYAITTKKDLSSEQVRAAIAETFADATSNDVSLFFIATHGDTNSGAGSRYAGALSTVKSGDSILFESLASWLNAVPGKVIVILESCGSGAAIYSNSRSVSKGDAGISDDVFSQSLIEAFAQREKENKLTLAKTGELRIENKFYVLAASDLQQPSWGYEGSKPNNYFTLWLTNGIGTSGTMPADADSRYSGNRDGIVTLQELYQYISAVGDNYPLESDGQIYYQTVKCYPENSSFQLFTR